MDRICGAKTYSFKTQPRIEKKENADWGNNNTTVSISLKNTDNYN